MRDFSWAFNPKNIETAHEPTPKTLTHIGDDTHTFIDMRRREKAESVLTRLPQNGEIMHIVSNGSFDYFAFVPIAIDLLGGKVESLWASTWTMNGTNVNELLELIDASKISECAMFTGLYFKHRESSVYAKLTEGLQARGQRIKSSKNHTKVTLIRQSNNYICMQSSANFTANPRMEQTVIFNDKHVYDFHKQWMDEILNG